MSFAIVGAGIGFLIFIHELGHFLVAKGCGVRVEKFSLGFGPRLAGFRRGDTEYVISLIPLGGYVKMAGENPGEGGTGRKDEFTSKSISQRAAIALAGIAMNTLTAIAAFIVAYRIGVQAIAPVVGGTEMGWPARQAGLLEGDRIVRVGGTEVRSFDEVIEEVALGRGATVRLDVERPRGSGSVPMQLEIPRQRDEARGIPKIGVTPPLSTSVEEIDIQAASPAQQAGLKPADRILAVEGRSISSWKEMEQALARRPRMPTRIRVERGGEPMDLTVLPQTLWTTGVERAVRVTVKELFQGSPAERQGLRPGDRILSVDGLPVETYEAFQRAVNAGELHPLAVQVEREDGTPETLRIRPSDSAEDGRRVMGFRPEVEPAPAVLADPALGTPARAAGLKGGDRILGVESKALVPVQAWGDAARALSAAAPGETLVLHCQRGAERRDVSLPAGTPKSLGLEPAVIAGAVLEGSPAAALGLAKGDRLRYLSLASPPAGRPDLASPLAAWEGMTELMQVAGRLTAEPSGLLLDWARDEGPEAGIHDRAPLGVVPTDPLQVLQIPTSSMITLGAYPSYLHVRIVEPDVLAAVAAGFRKAKIEAVKIARTVASFFAPKAESVSPKNLGGVISIFQGANRFLAEGAGAFILFLGVISVNLAVLNLLPVPVLDGGLILFLLIEKVKGAPLSDRSMAVFQYAGLAMILSLVLFVTYHDLARLFAG